MTDTLEAIQALTSAIITQQDATEDVATARRALMRRARDEGHTQAAIANAAGVTQQRVGQLLTEGTRP